MTTWADIQKMPTSLDREYFDGALKPLGDRCEFAHWKFSAPVGWHESLLRSFHIVQETKRLLELGTPPSVVLQVIALLEVRHDD